MKFPPLFSATLLPLLVGMMACDGGDDGNLTDQDGDGFYADAIDPTLVDCNDINPGVNPDASEICDNLDNDCNGEIDDNPADAFTWYLDKDLDGYGTSLADPVVACYRPEGYTSNQNDCFDDDPLVFPNAPERCNGEDDNCNQLEDEGLDQTSIWYLDADGDGWGGPEVVNVGCADNPNWTRKTGDCNDAFSIQYPGAIERCDGIDNDCDGLADDFDDDVADGTSPYYADVDADGYGNLLFEVQACGAPPGFVSNASDCDDNDPTRNPLTRWYQDRDDDGSGSNSIGAEWPTAQCWQPIGYVADNSDCDDNNPETIGLPAWYPDNDGDGFGGLEPVAYACTGQPGWVLESGDCADRNPNVKPDASEICDGVDNNCDDLTDDQDPTVTGVLKWYEDLDGDGFGKTDVFEQRCDPPENSSPLDGDCDDIDASLNPTTTWFEDTDGDGYGDPAMESTYVGCEMPPIGYVNNQLDCAPEDSTQSGITEWFDDNDGDGVGIGDVSYVGCLEDTTGYSLVTGDCLDSDSSVDEALCFEPFEGLVEFTVVVDNDARQTARLECTFINEQGNVVSASPEAKFYGPPTANTTDVVDWEVPAGRECNVALNSTRPDTSADGSISITVALCGEPSGLPAFTAPQDQGIVSSTDTFIVPTCSGCTDPAASNYSEFALVDNGTCID